MIENISYEQALIFDYKTPRFEVIDFQKGGEVRYAGTSPRIQLLAAYIVQFVEGLNSGSFWLSCGEIVVKSDSHNPGSIFPQASAKSLGRAFFERYTVIFEESDKRRTVL